jgi:cation:H+ antiporter
MQLILDSKSFASVSITSPEIIGTLSFSNGLILLSFFIIFLYYTYGISKSSSDAPDVKKRSTKAALLLIIAGIAGLVIGSRFFVDNAVTIARAVGVSDTFIGLTVVAVGTSLPELVTSIVAALKKQVQLAVGNIVGSNIFNIFFILGVTALINDIPISGKELVDIFVLFIATLILFISLFVYNKRCINRVEGALMLCSYIAYLAFLIIRG